jgi:glutathione synthase/RimK-type ligase-like ATP-grasp enzyme
VILTDSINLKSTQPFGTITSLCEEFNELCKKHQVDFYVTSLKNLHGDDLKGFQYTEAGWSLTDVNPPSVIHNRIHSRSLEKSEEFKQLISFLDKNKIPFFNARYLNKFEVFQSFIDSNYLKPYVPHTEQFFSEEQLQNFIQKYSSVFIKPIHGSKGRNILKVTAENNQILLQNSQDSKEERVFQSVSQLFQLIKPMLKRKAFIIQEGLSLLMIDERLVDFRYLCHKNQYNKWEVTSTTARIGHPSQFVSNIAQGGEMQKIDEFLGHYLPRKEKIHLKKLLSELALECCKWIDSNFEGLFCELGIDLALDKQFNPWVIELNSKPSKDLQLSDPLTKIRPSTKAIFSLVQSYL